ncbi:MAG: hypothetical protein H6Q89_5736, partial [Myxococcaceae bacterium]|nr:hypothetical protein [Myxococcaceae bacterium]
MASRSRGPSAVTVSSTTLRRARTAAALRIEWVASVSFTGVLLSSS